MNTLLTLHSRKGNEVTIGTEFIVAILEHELKNSMQQIEILTEIHTTSGKYIVRESQKDIRGLMSIAQGK